MIRRRWAGLAARYRQLPNPLSAVAWGTLRCAGGAGRIDLTTIDSTNFTRAVLNPNPLSLALHHLFRENKSIWGTALSKRTLPQAEYGVSILFSCTLPVFCAVLRGHIGDYYLLSLVVFCLVMISL